MLILISEKSFPLLSTLRQSLFDADAHMQKQFDPLKQRRYSYTICTGTISLVLEILNQLPVYLWNRSDDFMSRAMHDVELGPEATLAAIENERHHLTRPRFSFSLTKRTWLSRQCRRILSHTVWVSYLFNEIQEGCWYQHFWKIQNIYDSTQTVFARMQALRRLFECTGIHQRDQCL